MFRHLSLKDYLKLLFSLALLVSIPLTVYTVTTQNFETRKKAASLPTGTNTSNPINPSGNLYLSFNKENLSRLTKEQLGNIASLNQEVINETKNLEKVARTGDASKIKSQEDLLTQKKSALQQVLKDLGIGQNIQNQLENINTQATTWTANYNSIFAKSEEDQKKLLGLKKPEAQITTSEQPSSPLGGSIELKDLSTAALPDFFDWRNLHGGKNYITPIKDQGNCGSCWAFGAVATLESSARAYFNQPYLSVDLSEQDLVSCYLTDGCNGATSYEIRTIFSGYFPGLGLPSENCFPYKATNSDCRQKCENWQKDVWKTVSFQEPELTKEAIKETLIKNGPVEVGMAVYYDFFSYEGGIYYHTSGPLMGYHAVTIVGYGKSDGLDYWIVKNSWSEKWGENGYFRIFAGECKIDSWFAYAVKEPVPPYPDPHKNCVDSDEDGFCIWGLGEKPTTGCPSCDAAISDCDDSNATIHASCGLSTEKLGSLNITSGPSDAVVYVLDKTTNSFVYRGRTPLSINLGGGLREIKISQTDYEDFITSVDIKENQTSSLNVSLLFATKLTTPLNNDIFRAGDKIEIKGTIGGDDTFKNYTLEYGLGKQPTSWQNTGITLVNGGSQKIIDGTLADWDTGSVTKPDYFTLRLTVNYASKQSYLLVQDLFFDPTIKKGWPIRINYDETDCWEFSALKTSNNFYSYPDAGRVYAVKTDDFLTSFNSQFQAGGKCYYFVGFLEPVVNDINDDGLDEVIVTKHGHPQLLVYQNNGSLLWSRDVGTTASEGYYISMPLVGDINNDKLNEIIIFITKDFDQDSRVYAFNYDGSILWTSVVPKDYQAKMLMSDLNSDGNIEIVIKGTDASFDKMAILDKNGQILHQWDLENAQVGGDIMSSPAIGNFDDDPDLEIVAASPAYSAGPVHPLDEYSEWNNTGTIYIYNMDGTVVSGWPVYTDGIILSSPNVGDVNNDGKQEIVIGTMYISNTFPDYRYGGIYVFDRYGKILPGWPYHQGYSFWSTPALGDIDNDGDLEISVSELGFKTSLLHHDNRLVTGWPQSTSWNDYYSTIIGDINSDNSLDILTTAGPGVYAWTKDGTLISDFPKATEVDAQSFATIADIDRDGTIELVASSNRNYDWVNDHWKYRGSLYVWELTGSYSSKNMPWPTFHHDNHRTGLYNYSPPNLKVFVSSKNYNGNLGGLAGADAKCQSLAQAAGLKGTFKAWLSDSTTNAKDRFKTKNLPYYRTDGLKVADNFADLTDGTIANPIKVDEKGQTIYIYYSIWTNTDKSGLKRSWHCQNWTSTSASAAKGDARSISSVWTASSLLSNCVTTQSRLYCFEDTGGGVVTPSPTTPTPSPTSVPSITPSPILTPTLRPSPTPSPTFSPILTPTPTPTLRPSPTPTPNLIPTPVTSSLKVFVSSLAYNGNLGGLAGADAKCQSLAQSAGLTGTFKAWLSTSSIHARNRFVTGNKPYVLANGTQVADNATDLTDGSLDHQIDLNENGSVNSGSIVWTGTTVYGTGSLFHCLNWTSISSSYQGTFGRSSYTTSSWTNYSSVTCNGTARLYCFQD